MIEEAMVLWLSNALERPVYLGAIPQSVSARPVIVISPPQSFDEGNTAKLTVKQKLTRFCISVHGNTLTDLTSPRDEIRTVLNAIAETRPQTQIGNFRCQSIIIEDIEQGMAAYKESTSDRRQPGANQQDYAYCDIHCFASYHRNNV